MPILVIATVAVLEFGIILLTQQAITTSAIEGVREAAKEGATTDSVKDHVQEFVKVHKLTLEDNPDVRLIIEGGPEGNEGDTSIPCSANGPTLAADQVRVTVCTQMTSVVPDLLNVFGFSLSGRIFEVSAIAQKE